MLSPRAPLFSVSLALALGCVLGLDGWIPFWAALISCAATGFLWWRLARQEAASLAAFYGFVIAAALTYTLLRAGTIDPADLRRLPDEKMLPATQWRGMVIEEPVAEPSATGRRAFDRTSFVLGLQSWRPTGGRFFDAPVDAAWRPAQGRIRCTLLGPPGVLSCGDQLEFAAALTPVAAPLCPGQIDDRAFEGEQGIYYHAAISAANWRRTQNGAGNLWQNFSYRARDWAYARLQIGLEDDPRLADFLAGMLIGYRQEIPLDIEQDFRRTGTLHVFAVSGQNIAELMVVALVLLQLCGLVRWRWAWTLAPLVLAYCLLTGSPASAVRATLMVLAILAAWRFGRPLRALGCWSLALIAMLIWNPAILLDDGAQLSFAVVLGLILLSPPIWRLLARPFGPDPFLPRPLLTPGQIREENFWRWATALLAATFAATLVSEPITAVDFHQVTPISALANLIVVPAAGLITIVGTLSVACSLVSTLWAALLNNANWLFARLLIALVGFLAHRPGASINVPDVRAFASPPPSFLVAPVQDAACLLVRTRHGAWLFNTGRESVARSSTTHLLQFYGINRLDGLVLTQMSQPDNGGAAVIVRDFHPHRLVVPILRTHSPLEKTMAATITLGGVPSESWQQGQSFELGPGITVEVLGPDPAHAENRAEDRGLVLLFHADGGTLLWAGKIGTQAQEALLATHPNLRADVLVLGVEGESPAAWLSSLQVREWLQIPQRERGLNRLGPEPGAQSAAQAWPLDRVGAVDVHFVPPQGTQPGKILLRPWVALPAGL
jgi:competence protein ComEC